MTEALLAWIAARCAASAEERPTLDARYDVATLLDAGATASVWQAFDNKLARDVAIKVFRDRGGLAQVMVEARAASDVISDHVVRILDVHDGAPPYLVMELVGEHDPVCGRLVPGAAASACRPDSIEEALRWTIAVARGVHDAHLRNVFHRDLKPDNVLITPLSRRARIADFGLAVSASDHADAGTSLVWHRAGHGDELVAYTVTGTPEYMAPEQARGLPVALDPHVVEDRAILVGIDVWGLGALAFDLLADRPPWQSTADCEAWELAAREAPPPLPLAIPKRLRRIVARAMAPDARDRYASAAAFADELDAFLAARPTSLDRGRPVRVGLWCRRNPQLAIAGAITVALIALVLGARATVTRLRGERDALDTAVATQESELDALTKKVAKMRAELARTKAALAEEGRDLASLENQLAKERAIHLVRLREKEAALDDAVADARELSARIADVLADLEAAVKDRDRIRANNDALRRQVETARAALDAARAPEVSGDSPSDRERGEARSTGASQ